MTGPRVSVLIPCLNAERFLEETLISVTTQSLQAFEVIVVDDGSTDASATIARRFSPKVVVVPNVGRGASAARNHASRLAQGDYFQYVDADDLLDPHALAERVESLERAHADVAISDWERLESRHGSWVPVRRHTGALAVGAAAELQVFAGFWAPPVAVMYRRAMCERIGGWRDTLPVIQDARFLLDAARLGAKFSHVPRVGASYRQHRSDSLSSADDVRFWNDILRNTIEVESIWREDGSIGPDRRNALAANYANCVRVGLKRDRSLFLESLSHLRRFPEYVPPATLRAAMQAADRMGYPVVRALASLPGLRSRI